jgi:CheY-like chemotaxis protein
VQLKILIAEDDPVSRKMVAAVLENKGYEVIQAADGEEAWSVMQRSDAPKMLVLDWNMPKMDGLELVRRIRHRPFPFPPYIIMLTVNRENSDVMQAMDAQVNDYLIKPFQPEELLHCIHDGQEMLDLRNSTL